MEEGADLLAGLQLAWDQVDSAFEALVAWLMGYTGCSEEQARQAIEDRSQGDDLDNLVEHIKRAMAPIEK